MDLRTNPTRKIDDFLRFLVERSGLELTFQTTSDLVCGAMASSSDAAESPADAAVNAPPPATGNLTVEFFGPDTRFLTARKGELLYALENVVAQVLRLNPEDHDRISFDADSFKANRDRDLRNAVESAIASVRETGKPYAFQPMTSRERRLLHLELSKSGLPTASSGEIPRRYVVLYPEGYDPTARNIAPPTPAIEPGNALRRNGGPVTPVRDREHAVRSSFRRR